MRRVLKQIVAVWCWMAVAISVQSATYFVDFDTGDDTNDGLSSSTPWKRSPGDASATDNPAGTTLTAGDIVKLKGGIVYSNRITISASGSAGNPIRFDGNLAGDWGTGRAIIDRGYSINSRCFSLSSGVSFIEILHIKMQNVGDYADDATNVLSAAAGTYTNTVNTAGIGIDAYTGNNTNIVVGSCVFERIGGWRNTAGWDNGTIEGIGISFRDCKNIVITNCEMTKMKVGIGIRGSAWGASDVLIRSNNIHNYIVWGIDIASEQNGVAMVNITNVFNLIYNYAEFNAGNWAGVGDNPHTDGIFIRTAGLASYWTNVLCGWNQFYCSASPGDGGTASIYISQGPSAMVFSNLFDRDSHTRMVSVSWNSTAATPQRVDITNNTFISYSPHIGMTQMLTGRELNILNNIFYMQGGAPVNWIMINQSVGSGDPTILDYNVFYDSANSVTAKKTHYLGYYATFAQAQAEGFDLNSVYANPDFVSFGTGPGTRDTNLQSTSAARGAGQDGGDAGWLAYVTVGEEVTNLLARPLMFKGFKLK